MNSKISLSDEVGTGTLLMESFFEAHKRLLDNGCWRWKGRKNNRGYGVIVYPGEVYTKVHRLSWEFYCGPIPKGLEVCHRCDNPPCFNPEHLFLGTHEENMEDRKNKEYSARFRLSRQPAVRILGV